MSRETSQTLSRLQPKDIVVLILVMIFWGGAFTAGRVAVVELGAYTVATLRYALASLCLLAVLHHREGLAASLRGVTRHGAFMVALVALFGVMGYNVLLLVGLKYSNAINGALIAGLAPLSTAFLAVLILRDRLTAWQLTGMLVSFAGIIVLVSRGSLSLLVNLEFNKGDLLILAAMLCFGAQSICAKRSMGFVSPLAAITYSCLIGSVCLVPFMLGELSHTGWSHPSFDVWVALVYLAIIATVLAYLGWFYVVERHGAARPAPFVNLVTVFGVFIGMIWGEELFAAQAVAAVLVLAGVRIASIRSRPALAAAPLAVKEGDDAVEPA